MRESKLLRIMAYTLCEMLLDSLWRKSLILALLEPLEIGRTPLPPWVKLFIWGLCRNTIPTRLLLRDKGVVCASICFICQSGLKMLRISFSAAGLVLSVGRQWVYGILSPLSSIMHNLLSDIIFSALTNLQQSQIPIPFLLFYGEFGEIVMTSFGMVNTRRWIRLFAMEST